MDTPCGLSHLYPDHNRIPSLSIARFTRIFIFRYQTPYYKFQLPTIQADLNEIQIWAQFKMNINQNEIPRFLQQLGSARRDPTDEHLTVAVISADFIVTARVDQQVQKHPHPI